MNSTTNYLDKSGGTMAGLLTVSSITATGGITLKDGTVITSTNGLGGWTATATSALNMNTFPVNNVATMTATGNLLFNGGSDGIPATGAGTRMMWYPAKQAFRAGYVDGTQWDDSHIGNYSFASGYNTTASNTESTAMGYGTTASQFYSSAIGYNATASGIGAFAMGYTTTASGLGATSLGWGSTASGSGASTMGYYTTASGSDALALGYCGTAAGSYSTAIGSAVVTSAGSWSVGMGQDVQSTAANNFIIGKGDASHNFLTNSTPNSLMVGFNSTTPELTVYQSSTSINGTTVVSTITSSNGGLLFSGTNGGISATGSGTRLMWYPAKSALRAGIVNGTQWDNSNIGSYSMAFGQNPISSGTASFAAGHATNAGGDYSSAFGDSANAGGTDSVAMGYSTNAGASYSVAMGNATVATGQDSVAMGFHTNAGGMGATALGFVTSASGSFATAMGEYATASGGGSVAMGDYATASGTSSTAIGQYATAIGDYSTAFGAYTTSGGTDSTAMGNGSSALGNYSTAIGSAVVTSAGSWSIGMGQDVQSTAANNFVIGKGDASHNFLTNSTANSLMVGFNQTTPTFTVFQSSVIINGVAGGTGDVLVISTGTDSGNNRVARIDNTGKGWFNGGTATGGADYAEWFKKEENCVPGDIIGLDLSTSRVRKYVPGDILIGICSTKPGFIGNQNIDTSDKEMGNNYVLVGLVGQLNFNKEQVHILGKKVETKDGKQIGYLLDDDRLLLKMKSSDY